MTPEPSYAGHHPSHLRRECRDPFGEAKKVKFTAFSIDVASSSRVAVKAWTIEFSSLSFHCGLGKLGRIFSKEGKCLK